MMTHTAHRTIAPSRHDNPFATCWTRPGALAFRFVDGQSAQQLVMKLSSQNWWGEIVGPHGSGKSTLLEALKPALVAAGRRVHAITLRAGERILPRDFLNWDGCPVLILDGYEQLGWFSRWCLKRRCRRIGAGLLVTSHTPTGLPTLMRLAPDRQLVTQLVADLCAEVSSSVTPADVAASHACHGSNVREILFDLYDRHERLRGSLRTEAGINT
jgi:energy-coupling factor transporter ATP-binding protein EcfA2